jgi:GTP cyclohydrolase I
MNQNEIDDLNIQSRPRDKNKESSLTNGATNKIEKISILMREILEIVYPNAKSEIKTRTPTRFAEALLEFTEGYNENLDELMTEAIFDSEDYHDLIIIKEINFSSICEHHLLPFFGECTIGYIPDQKILGLSKFPRLVNSLSKKMHLQERLTKEIAETINYYLKPRGAIVILNASHSCMCFRGVKSFDTKTETVYSLGELKDKNNYYKFFNLLSINRK